MYYELSKSFNLIVTFIIKSAGQRLTIKDRNLRNFNKLSIYVKLFILNTFIGNVSLKQMPTLPLLSLLELQALINLYPFKIKLSSSLQRELLRKVLGKQIISNLFTQYRNLQFQVRSTEILTNSWSVILWRFQWQKEDWSTYMSQGLFHLQKVSKIVLIKKISLNWERRTYNEIQ